jgi:hypothetical protein
MIQATPIAGAFLQEAMQGQFNDLVTIYTGSETVTKGDVAKTHSVIRPGHEDIPAIIAPGNVGNARMKRQETMSSTVTTQMEYNYVMLLGAWPLIELEDTALFSTDGEKWAIIAIDIEQTSTFTKMMCEKMKPGNIQ